MGQRRRAREDTLRILFQFEFNNTQPEKMLTLYWDNIQVSKEVREYSTWLVNGVVSHLDSIDDIIQSISEHWRISRMALVDRNILRIAVFELLYEENLAPAIVINEAIEIAKKYSGDDAATFINGILDAVRKNLEKIKKTMEEKENG